MVTPLSRSEVDAAVHAVTACAEMGELDRAWSCAAVLRDRAAGDGYAAHALALLVGRSSFDASRSVEALQMLFAAHANNTSILAALGEAFSGAVDIRFLNAAPPSAVIFREIAQRLRARAAGARDTEHESTLLGGLATAARILGRSWDADAELAFRRLVELQPERWERSYDLGLFYKVRGRFAEGVAANQRAVDLGGGDDDATQWNLGICATGARDAAVALAVWKNIGQKIEIGRFDLPEGGYDAVKVRLAERPLAERSAAHDDPGLEETIWIDRLSPCHGVVRSALFESLGVDYGDVVLFDGAPVTHHTYGDRRVPVFPHLATIQRSGYQMWPFAGTQPRAGAIQALSESLPEDAVLYSHSEQFVTLCAHCWGDQQLDHSAHRPLEHHVVRGKLCAPPHVAPAALRLALDRAVAEAAKITLFVPELSQRLGDHARADVERRRIATIDGAKVPKN